MKTAIYHSIDGKEIKVEYDENAPCIICGEPVKEASMGGTAICAWCDMGRCRFCGEQFYTGREKTRAECEAVVKIHIIQCKEVLNGKA